MSESQTALIFNMKFANINFLRVRKRSRMEKFGHEQKTYFSSTRRYFQGNSEACRTELIQKSGIGFPDNKNLSSLPIIDGNQFNAWYNSKFIKNIPGNWLGLFKEISVRHHRSLGIYMVGRRQLCKLPISKNTKIRTLTMVIR